MKVKKSPKADLNRNSGLYFVIGLALALFLTWRALEYKSYNTTLEEVIVAHLAEPDLREEVPLTENLKPLPPPVPPSAPTIIEIVDDTEDIEETIIQSTETNQESVIEAPIIAVYEVVVAEEEEEITVPFAVIEDVPIFPGCDEGTDDERRACFQRKIQEHVGKNFKYPPVAVEMGIQGKVYVQFLINTEGHVTRIKSRGPDRLLEEEAERIIASLPRMTPGRQRGQPVNVPYSIPVNFKLMF